MSPGRFPVPVFAPVCPWLPAFAAAALFLTFSGSGHAQSTDSQPSAVGKQRTALYLKALHAPLKELESDLNHLAVVSESCRAEYGAKSCGLPDKPLGSDKLEARYEYYVKDSVEARFNGHGVRVERRNWERPAAPDSK
jgi:hypothetical protein